jgi:hypothetical protein
MGRGAESRQEPIRRQRSLSPCVVDVTAGSKRVSCPSFASSAWVAEHVGVGLDAEISGEGNPGPHAEKPGCS